MKTESLGSRVALHPFLAGIEAQFLDLLTGCADPVRFKEGQVMFREGERADHFYLIEKGEVALESNTSLGRRMLLERIGPGDLLGWSWMFPPYTWHFGARVVKPVHAVSFSGETLRHSCERDPSLGYELFKRMAPVMLRRLQSARKTALAWHDDEGISQPFIPEPTLVDAELDSD